jgi:hypothetical protein
MRIYLDDNKLLSEEKKTFAKVENFDRFPLLKINGIVYYGKLKVEHVFGFICKHVKPDLVGCSHYIRTIDGKGSHFFTVAVIVLVGMIFLYLMRRCKLTLLSRHTRQMNYQVDASISKFLERTGGDSL